MSGGGGGGGQTQTSGTMPDRDYQMMRNEIWKASKGVYEGGQKYAGPVTAGFTTDQLQGRSRARTGIGMGQDVYKDAVLRGQKGMTFTPGQATTTQVGGAEIAQFMNPYQSEVIDRTVAAQQDFLKGALENESARAIGSGALDNSRSAITRGQVIGDVARDTGQQVAALQQQGYQDAVMRAQTAAERQDATQRFNIQNQFQTENMQLAAANQMTQLQQLAKADFMNDANAQMQLGAIQQQMNQMGLDFDREEFMRLEPENRLQMIQAMLGAGAGQQSIATGPGRQRNNSTAALGLGIVGAGVGAYFGGPAGAGVGYGIGSGIGSMI